MADPVIPSRLSRAAAQGGRPQGPATGLGSGYAQNQRLAGASDPDAAAKLAGMDPGEAQKVLEDYHRAEAALSEQRDALKEAAASKRWLPPSLPDGAEPLRWLDNQPPNVIQMLHAQFIKKVSEDIDKEEEEGIPEDPFRIQPDHPAYMPMNDRARRARVEKDLAPIPFEEMIFRGFCEQQVELRPGFKVTFRTISTQHGLWLEQRLASVTDETNQYVGHWFSIQQLSAGTHLLGSKMLGSAELASYDTKESFYAAVDERAKLLGKLPQEFTNDLLANYAWFCGRVRKLLQGNLIEKVGN